MAAGGCSSCTESGCSLRAADIPALVADTEGASPAFIRELLRRAALLAGERSAGELIVDGEILQAGCASGPPTAAR